MNISEIAAGLLSLEKMRTRVQKLDEALQKDGHAAADPEYRISGAELDHLGALCRDILENNLPSNHWILQKWKSSRLASSSSEKSPLENLINFIDLRTTYFRAALDMAHQLEKGQMKMSKIATILFLAANPKGTPHLRLDDEMQAIDSALRQAEFRDRFDIEQQWAVRVADLQGYFLRYKPDIVHFSGHGSTSSEIILEDNHGSAHPVSPRALNQLFKILKDDIRCVVLNACYSEQQAQAIAKHVDCVVGMSKAIGDEAAISFARAFYEALGYGRSVKDAFDLGCNQIDLESLEEQDTPKLFAEQKNPESIVLVHCS